MALPTDQTLTKLRILMERAARERAVAKEDLERAQKEAWKKFEPFNRKADEAFQAYYARAQELGYCALCQKRRGECRCVLEAVAA